MGDFKEYDLAPDFKKGGGLIGIGERVDDKILGVDMSLDLLDEQTIDYQVKYLYNQGAQWETRNWCTVFAGITALSYKKNRQFSLDEIYEIGRQMVKDGKLNPDKGAYLVDAAQYIEDWYNANHKDKIRKYQIDLFNKDIEKKLDVTRAGLIQIGYRTSDELFLDTQVDGVAMGKEYPWYGGHSVCKYGLNIKDNYEGQKKFNSYSFHYFDELLKNGTIFQHGYIYLNQ